MKPQAFDACAALVGLAWAAAKHAVCLQAAGTAPRALLRLAQRPAAMNAGVPTRRPRVNGQPVAVCLERHTGPRVSALCHDEVLGRWPVKPPVPVSAVYAQEPSPPQGEEPIEWLLLTSVPVTDFPRACTVVQWYRCRWDMELFWGVLKQGCKIEQWRMQTAQRLLNALAIYFIVAWRLHNIKMAGRAYPAMSCAVVFEPREWQTLYTMQHHCHPPPTPPPLREMVRSRAQFGGFFTRQGDGEPGINAMWQGYQRRHAFIYAVETSRIGNAGERNV
jgi:hypothetical protein